MGWLRLLAGLVSIVDAITNWLRERQLVNTGKQLQQRDDLEKAVNNALIAKEVDRKPVTDAELLDGLRHPNSRGDKRV